MLKIPCIVPFSIYMKKWLITYPSTRGDVQTSPVVVGSIFQIGHPPHVYEGLNCTAAGMSVGNPFVCCWLCASNWLKLWLLFVHHRPFVEHHSNGRFSLDHIRSREIHHDGNTKLIKVLNKLKFMAQQVVFNWIDYFVTIKFFFLSLPSILIHLWGSWVQSATTKGFRCCFR